MGWFLFFGKYSLNPSREAAVQDSTCVRTQSQQANGHAHTPQEYVTLLHLTVHTFVLPVVHVERGSPACACPACAGCTCVKPKAANGQVTGAQLNRRSHSSSSSRRQNGTGQAQTGRKAGMEGTPRTGRHVRTREPEPRLSPVRSAGRAARDGDGDGADRHATSRQAGRSSQERQWGGNTHLDGHGLRRRQCPLPPSPFPLSAAAAAVAATARGRSHCQCHRLEEGVKGSGTDTRCRGAHRCGAFVPSHHGRRVCCCVCCWRCPSIPPSLRSFNP